MLQLKILLTIGTSAGLICINIDHVIYHKLTSFFSHSPSHIIFVRCRSSYGGFLVGVQQIGFVTLCHEDIDNDKPYLFSTSYVFGLSIDVQTSKYQFK